jgi:polysaccharide pyruvyl transferase WcaK-like protein
LFEPSVADEFDEVGTEWLSGAPQAATAGLIEKIRAADIVVFHAEGTTYRVNRSAIRCLFALWFARQRLGTPALFVNGSVTLGPVDPVLPAMVAKTFRAIDGVTVREPCSLRHVRECVPDVDVRLVPDSVFTIERDEARRWEEIDPALRNRLGDTPFFCMSLSMLAGMQAGYMRHGAAGSSLAELIRRLKQFVPQAVLMARDGMDQSIARGLAQATGAVLLGPQYEFRDVLALLRRARMLISGRYHHLILGAIAGCPAVPLSTSSHKIDGLCELMDGLMGKTTDATDLRSAMDALEARALRILSDSELPRRLRLRAAQLRVEAEGLGRIVADRL